VYFYVPFSRTTQQSLFASGTQLWQKYPWGTETNLRGKVLQALTRAGQHGRKTFLLQFWGQCSFLPTWRGFKVISHFSFWISEVWITEKRCRFYIALEEKEKWWHHLTLADKQGWGLAFRRNTSGLHSHLH